MRQQYRSALRASRTGHPHATFSFETDDPNNCINQPVLSASPPPPVLEDPGTSYDGQGIILTNPYGIATSPDGKYIYAMGETSDSISVYERDMTTGALVNTQAVGDLDGYLDGARMMTISPDGMTAYVSEHRRHACGLLVIQQLVVDASTMWKWRNKL
jgi:DNA-binding beta-propeller fold protein YncE